jgi:hypothetical protein
MAIASPASRLTCSRLHSLTNSLAKIVTTWALIIPAVVATQAALGAGQSDSADANQPVLVIAMDGAGTCFKNNSGEIAPADISLASTMHKVVNEIQSKGLSKDVKVIKSCLLLDGKSGAYSTNLGAPEVMEDLSLDQLLPEIAARVNDLPEPRVVVVGFSYGGWLALKLLPMIEKQAKILGLLTIDPISMDQCPMIDLLNGALRGEPLTGCTSAPSDVTSEELSTATQKPGSWLNVYQDTGFYLHSGPFGGARNVVKNHPNTNPRSIWTHFVLTWDESYTTWMSQEFVKNAAW